MSTLRFQDAPVVRQEDAPATSGMRFQDSPVVVDRDIGSYTNVPENVETKLALQQDLPPPVHGKYDPQQSFWGYTKNEFLKNIAGLLGLPDTAMRSIASQPEYPVHFLLGNIYQGARRMWTGEESPQPVASQAAKVLGVDPNIRPPSPEAEFASNITTDVIANAVIPGGGLLLRVLSGIGSGAGRTLGQAFGPAGEVLGSVGGAVLGGRLAAPLEATGKGIQFAKQQWNRPREDVIKDLNDAINKIKANPSYRDEVRKGILDELAEDLRKDPSTYTAKLEEAQRLSDMMRDRFGIELRLNLGQMTEAPSVIGQQKAIAKADPTLAKAQHDLQQSQLRRAMAGEGAIEEEARGAITGVINRQAKQVDDAERALRNQDALIQAEGQKYNVPIDQVEAGQRALKMRASARAQQVAIADEIEREVRQLAKAGDVKFDLMDALDESGVSIIGRAQEIARSPVWSNAVVPETARVLKRLGLIADDAAKAADEAIPRLVDSSGSPIAKEAATPEALQSFDSIFDLRKALNADIAAAQRSMSPDSGSLLWALRALKRDLDATMRQSGHTKVVERYFDWVDQWRENVGRRFDRGVSKLAAKENVLGDPRLPPEQVFRQFFKAKNATNMDRFLQVYGGSSESIDMMERAIMDRYLEEAVDKATFSISPQKHAAFMSRYREPLSVLEKNNFPIRSRLESRQSAYRAMVDRRTELQLDLEAKQKDEVVKFLKGKFGNQHPNRVFDNALNDAGAMDAVMSRMSATERRASIRYIGDVIMRRITDLDGNVSGDALRQILSNTEQSAALRTAFDHAYGKGASTQHMKLLDDFAAIADRIEATSLGPTQATPARGLYEDTLTPQLGFSWKTLFNMGRAIAMGRNNPIFAANVLASQAGLTQFQNFRREVMKEVIEDPQTARQLRDLMKGPVSGGAWKKAWNWLMTKSPKIMRFVTGPIEETTMRGLITGGAEMARHETIEQ